MKELASLLRDEQKIKVALDVDSTIADILPLMISDFNKIKGTSFTVDDCTDWNFTSIGSNYLEMMPLYVNVWKNRWQDIQFTANVEHINELIKYYDVSLLTTRSATNEGITGGTVDTMHKWLNLHNLGHISVQICDPKQNKARDFDYQIYLDDSPGLAETIEKMDRKLIFLVDQKYNQHILESERVRRVPNVQAAVNLLVDAARAHKLPQRIK